MKKHFLRWNILATIVLLMVIAASTLSLAAESRSKNGVRGKWVESLEEDPRAIIKEGFYGGVKDQRVTLKHMIDGSKTSFRLEDNYRVLFEEVEITFEEIDPDSIIKLIMIEGQIREVILLQRSS